MKPVTRLIMQSATSASLVSLHRFKVQNSLDPSGLTSSTNFGIGEPFHMMDFASRRNAYKKWTETKRKKLLAALVELVVTTPGVKPLGVMVCMPAYREIPEVERLRLRNPYLVALENCIRTSVFGSIAEMEATRGELVPRIQIVLARNKGYSGKGADLWGWMRQFDALGVTGMFMDSIKIVPRTSTPLSR